VMSEMLASVGSVVPGLALRVTLVLGLAWSLQRLLPSGASAALRHVVWTLSLAGVLVLPLIGMLGPSWSIEVRRVVAPADAPALAVDDSSVSGPAVDQPAVIDASPTASAASSSRLPSGVASLSWPVTLGALYLAGLLASLVMVARQRWQLWRFCRASTPIADGPWLELLVRCAAVMGVRDGVRLLRGGHVVPLTCGTWRPTIVVPAAANGWDHDRREAVLLHELAHVMRRDCLTQLIASLACATAWYHPGVWLVARRMRQERELACDDRVVGTGTPARGYAGHLLDIAYAFAGDRAPTQALAMARPRQLESRMRALLDGSRDRRPAGWATKLALTTASALLVLPLAAVNATVVAVAPDSLAPLDTVRSTAAAIDDTHIVDAAVEAQTRQLASLVTTERTSQQAARNARAADRDDEGPDTPGTWEVRTSDREGSVHLRMTQGRSSNGHTVRVDTFAGLAEALRSNGTPAKFQLKRDAGAFMFEGVFRGGVGAGTFAYTADPTFPDALARRGFTRPTALEQYQMARHDVGFALIDALAEQGYGKPQTAELIKAGQHGVSATYVKEMAALGYKLPTLDALITLRDHGVTPSYVRELAELGYKGLSADEVRNARDHGITPDYVRGMTAAGYSSLPMAGLINARDHGVNPDYVKGLADAGYRGLPLEELIRVRDHGVNAEYLAAMKTHGYTEPIARLVTARDHGISADYVKEMAALGYARLPLDQLIKMRDHGVSVDYVTELKAMGYEKIAPEDLITLRNHGFTASRIKRVNSRSGSKLPVAALLEALRGGSEP
jgi:beta-lactamase regulating signal transducer with metallopeptidase domain